MDTAGGGHSPPRLDGEEKITRNHRFWGTLGLKM